MQRAWWPFVVGSFLTRMVLQRVPARILAPSPSHGAAPTVFLPRAIGAHVIGVPPGQFVTRTVRTQALESLAPATVRLRVGVVGARGLVRPRLHRLHHAMGVGHAGPAQGCHWAVLRPLGDLMWPAAHLQHRSLPTGVRDHRAGHASGRGFWPQPWLGLQRVAATCTRRPLSLAHHPKRGHTP